MFFYKDHFLNYFFSFFNPNLGYGNQRRLFFGRVCFLSTWKSSDALISTGLHVIASISLKFLIKWLNANPFNSLQREIMKLDFVLQLSYCVVIPLFICVWLNFCYGCRWLHLLHIQRTVTTSRAHKHLQQKTLLLPLLITHQIKLYNLLLNLKQLSKTKHFETRTSATEIFSYDYTKLHMRGMNLMEKEWRRKGNFEGLIISTAATWRFTAKDGIVVMLMVFSSFDVQKIPFLCTRLKLESCWKLKLKSLIWINRAIHYLNCEYLIQFLWLLLLCIFAW